MIWRRSPKEEDSECTFEGHVLWRLVLPACLSGTTEQAVAADDLSRRNNLHVTKPNAPRYPDDVI